ncbi:uncharacterized protein G2W53_000664 [Senna tora]|uniref:Uncharacterized protein n=1 Tax=Senna tora TaxID=362788 RepID=A0A834XEC5_9FABA|nr:uncharacterized protein G2W53_000664 [Senna tora]
MALHCTCELLEDLKEDGNDQRRAVLELQKLDS